jgi:ABC-type lipoprotein export system ATPase subunit
MELVGIGDWATHRPPEMSGGQQQRVAIARAIYNEARGIVADDQYGNQVAEAARNF